MPYAVIYWPSPYAGPLVWGSFRTWPGAVFCAEMLVEHGVRCLPLRRE